jgi:hypothetical protein
VSKVQMFFIFSFFHVHENLYVEVELINKSFSFVSLHY